MKQMHSREEVSASDPAPPSKKQKKNIGGGLISRATGSVKWLFSPHGPATNNEPSKKAKAAKYVFEPLQPLENVPAPNLEGVTDGHQQRLGTVSLEQTLTESPNAALAPFKLEASTSSMDALHQMFGLTQPSAAQPQAPAWQHDGPCFVGREQDVAHLLGYFLTDSGTPRAACLVGGAGVGKTAVACGAASWYLRLLGSSLAPASVLRVNLQGTRDCRDFGAAMLAAINGTAPQGGATDGLAGDGIGTPDAGENDDVINQLLSGMARLTATAPSAGGDASLAAAVSVAATKPSRLLLVLDNVEHLLAGTEKDQPACVALLEKLILSSGADLLITSRQPVRLPSLAVETRTLRGLAAAPSLSLVRSTAPALSEADAAVVAALCGGVPRLLWLVARALSSDGRLTMEVIRGLVPGSLEEVTFQVLPPALQQALAQLGVFAASFDGPAAAEVLGVGEQQARSTIQELYDLGLLRNRSAGHGWLLDGRVKFAARLMAAPITVPSDQINRRLVQDAVRAAEERHTLRTVTQLARCCELWRDAQPHDNMERLAVQAADELRPEIVAAVARLAAVPPRADLAAQLAALASDLQGMCHILLAGGSSSGRSAGGVGGATFASGEAGSGRELFAHGRTPGGTPDVAHGCASKGRLVDHDAAWRNVFAAVHEPMLRAEVLCRLADVLMHQDGKALQAQEVAELGLACCRAAAAGSSACDATAPRAALVSCMLQELLRSSSAVAGPPALRVAPSPASPPLRGGGDGGGAAADDSQALQHRVPCSLHKTLHSTRLSDAAACALYNQGEYGAAERRFRAELGTLERQKGAEHVHVAAVLHDVGDCLKAQARYGEAVGLYRRAAQIRRKLLGESNPGTLASQEEEDECIELQACDSDSPCSVY